MDGWLKKQIINVHATVDSLPSWMKKNMEKEIKLYDTPENILERVCYEVENAIGDLGCFTVPNYLKAWWEFRRDDYYQKIEKEQRRQQYLKLKMEFEPDEHK